MLTAKWIACLSTTPSLNPPTWILPTSSFSQMNFSSISLQRKKKTSWLPWDIHRTWHNKINETKNKTSHEDLRSQCSRRKRILMETWGASADWYALGSVLFWEGEGNCGDGCVRVILGGEKGRGCKVIKFKNVSQGQTKETRTPPTATAEKPRRKPS